MPHQTGFGPIVSKTPALCAVNRRRLARLISPSTTSRIIVFRPMMSLCQVWFLDLLHVSVPTYVVALDASRSPLSKDNVSAVGCGWADNHHLP